MITERPNEDVGVSLGSIRIGMLKALAAFAAVLVFGFAPALDAVACAAEPPAVMADHDVSAHAPADADDHGPGETACLHGHCHHSQAPTPPEQGLAQVAYAGAAALPPDAAERLRGLSLTGLKRPPRG